MTRPHLEQSGSILLCLDGSPAAATGVPYAVALARASGTGILLLSVLEQTAVPHQRAVDALATEVARQAAVEYLEKIQAGLEARGLLVEARLVEGDAATQIIQTADKEQVHIIVMAAHGSREATQFRLGGTAEKVIQHSHYSIFLAPWTEKSVVKSDCVFERIVVLLDGSQAAEASLVSAQAFARETGAEIVLGHIASCTALLVGQPLIRSDQELLQRLEERTMELARSYLRSLEQTLLQEGLGARYIVIRNDDKRQGVLDLVREVNADLIVLASHGQTSCRHAVHGSLTQHLLSYAHVPLWVVQNLHRQHESADRRDGASHQQGTRSHAGTGK